jgi:hypothetical protein
MKLSVRDTRLIIPSPIIMSKRILVTNMLKDATSTQMIAHTIVAAKKSVATSTQLIFITPNRKRGIIYIFSSVPASAFHEASHLRP